MLFPSICQSLLRHDHSLGLDRFPFHQELEPLTWGISALGAFFFLTSVSSMHWLPWKK